MVAIGKLNELEIIAIEHDRLGLSDNVFLPIGEADKSWTVGDRIKVFVFVGLDSQYHTTTKTPLVQVGDVAWLKVISTSHAGAFLDCGLAKDILLPFSEQTYKVPEGRRCLVKIFLDESNRLTASMMLNDFIQDQAFYFTEGQQVDLIIADETDLGFKAVVNNEFWGILYKNEVFQRLHKGDKVVGYIKKLREDHKLDLILQTNARYAVKVDAVGEKILAKLEAQEGVLLLSDKSPPELIYNTFGVSKKVFKQSIGALFKQRLIDINETNISLVKK